MATARYCGGCRWIRKCAFKTSAAPEDNRCRNGIHMPCPDVQSDHYGTPCQHATAWPCSACDGPESEPLVRAEE